MGETLMQQRRVDDEGFRVVKSFLGNDNDGTLRISPG